MTYTPAFAAKTNGTAVAFVAATGKSITGHAGMGDMCGISIHSKRI